MILQGHKFTIDNTLCNLLSNNIRLFDTENVYTGKEIEDAITTYITDNNLWYNTEESICINHDIRIIIGDYNIVFLEDLYHKLMHLLKIV